MVAVGMYRNTLPQERPHRQQPRTRPRKPGRPPRSYSSTARTPPAGHPFQPFTAVFLICCVFDQPRRPNKFLVRIMSARRQSSTTSLAKYARTTSPDTSSRNLDFCNAFWGVGDGGVDVLFARMRGAARTMEELRNFWKERYVAPLHTSSLPSHASIRSRISSDRRLKKTMRNASQNWPRCRSERTRSGMCLD